MRSKRFLLMTVVLSVCVTDCRQVLDVDGDPLPADCTSKGALRCHNNVPQECDYGWEWSDLDPCPADRPVCYGDGKCSAIQSVSAGGRHSCILLAADGSIRCWGRNEHGELGNGTTIDSVKPVDVIGITGALDVKAGGSDDRGFTCAIMADRRMACWGNNTYYQLGNGEVEARKIPDLEIDLGGPVKQIALGAQHGCALLDGGTINCWGSYQLDLWATPTEIATIPTAIELDAGARHTCALTEDGRVYCWGSNLQGQCGQPLLTQASLKSPTEVPGIVGATKIATGYYHTCALVAGHTYCWGSNECGQLGRGNYCGEHCNTDITKPTEACGDPTPAAIIEENQGNHHLLDLGAYHSCIGTGSGSSKIVRCWGRGDYGQVGSNGKFVYDIGRPFLPTAEATLEAHAVEISVGAYHGCSLTTANEIRCWGRNDFGQLGIPATVEW